jgi:hypothetical protein
MLSGHGFVAVNIRAVANSLRGEVNTDGSVPTIDARDGGRRDEHSAPAQPSSGCDDQIPYDPYPIVEVEFARRSSCAIERENVTPLDARHELEHRRVSFRHSTHSIGHGAGKFRTRIEARGID